MKLLAAGVLAVLALAVLLESNWAGDDKPKFKIVQVMRKAHGKDGLLKKVAAGEASDAEKKELVELYKALAKNEPPKGDPKSWKKFTSALVKTAEAAAGGDEKAAKSLTKVVNCKLCHDTHREADE